MSTVLEGRLDSVLLDKISASKIALRPPKTDDEQFKQLLMSVRDRGVIKPIVINDNGDGTYTLIDGLQRFTAANMVASEHPERKFIDAKIVKINQEDELIIQIIANNNTVKTRPVEYAKGIIRILTANPDLTQSELANRLSISMPSLQNFLRLNNLADPIKEYVDNGDLRVTNAYALAKLPVEEQMNYLEDALKDSPEIFNPKIAEAQKRLKQANKGETIVGPTPRVRKLPEIREVYEAALSKIANVANPDPVVKAQVDILAWVIRLDAESVSTWKQEHEERERKKNEDQLKKQQEREADAKKKSEEAKAKLAALGA